MKNLACFVPWYVGFCLAYRCIWPIDTALEVYYTHLGLTTT